MFSALKWSFLSEMASKTIPPLVFVVLARLLTPEDYGVVAAVSMVTSFSQIFWEAGMGKALIQYQGDRFAAANSAFWVNMLLGVVVALTLFLISDLVSTNIFHDPRIAPVLRIMTLQVFLTASISVHVSLLQKDMRFRRLFWVRLVTVAIPGVVSVPLACYGMGYWALIIGTLVGQIFQVVILWKKSEWRPTITFDFVIARSLVGFGFWVAVSGLLAWFYFWADSFIVGIYLGAHQLGLYRTGNVFVIMIYSLLFGPVIPVFYSYLSGMQGNVAHMRSVLFKLVKAITFISIPVAFIIFANASFLAHSVFGEKWNGVGFVISVLALMHGYSWVVGLNGELYRAVGKPIYETQIMALNLGIYVLGYYFSIQRGFEAFVWSRLGLSFVSWGAHMWVAHKVIGFPVISCLNYLFKVSLISVPVVIASIWLGSELSLFHASAFFISSLLVVTASMVLFERKGLVPELFALLKRKTA